MSAAVKGRTLDDVQRLIATFKGMMSIHETSLGGEGEHANGLSPGPETVAGEPEQVDPAKLGELAALQGVVKFPVRIKCATLELERPGTGPERAGRRQPRLTPTKST